MRVRRPESVCVTSSCIQKSSGSEASGTSPLAPLSAIVTKTPNRVTPEMRAANTAPTLSAMKAAR